jgi:hypothetical protein
MRWMAARMIFFEFLKSSLSTSSNIIDSFYLIKSYFQFHAHSVFSVKPIFGIFNWTWLSGSLNSSCFRFREQKDSIISRLISQKNQGWIKRERIFFGCFMISHDFWRIEDLEFIPSPLRARGHITLERQTKGVEKFSSYEVFLFIKGRSDMFKIPHSGINTVRSWLCAYYFLQIHDIRTCGSVANFSWGDFTW